MSDDDSEPEQPLELTLPDDLADLAPLTTVCRWIEVEEQLSPTTGPGIYVNLEDLMLSLRRGAGAAGHGIAATLEDLWREELGRYR